MATWASAWIGDVHAWVWHLSRPYVDTAVQILNTVGTLVSTFQSLIEDFFMVHPIMILSFGKSFNQFLTDSSNYSNCSMDGRDLCFWRSRVVVAAFTWELRALTCLFLFSFLTSSICLFLYKIKIKANRLQLILMLHFCLLLACFRRTYRLSASYLLIRWSGMGWLVAIG